MKKIWIIIPMIILIILFSILGAKFSDCSLFNYNFMEILTTIVMTFGIYYLTKINDEKKGKNAKIEFIIELIQKKLNTVFGSAIIVERKEEYLHSFKYLYSKMLVLEKMCIHLKCDEDIKEINNELKKLDEFINENLNCGNEYFSSTPQKEKTPNILCNIENHLDNIVLKIYDSNDKKN